MTLYQTLKQHGIKTDNHESDLYIPVNNSSTAILLQFPVHFANATRFNCQGSHELYYDIPFAFEPYWEKRVVK